MTRWLLLGMAALCAACGGGGGGGSNPPPKAHGKWTVLVYLNAANDLYRFSPLNVNQMEQVAGNEDVRFVVQWKQSKDLFPSSLFNGTRRYFIRPDSSDDIHSDLVQDMGQGVDMGQVQTLRDFVAWGKANYPSDRYALVVWNHGNGWMRSKEGEEITRGLSYDDQTGNSIDTWQLSQALQGLGMDILAMDCSLMQMTEVVYEMRGQVPLVAGSEESPPGEGYPYHRVFLPFRDNPDASTTTLSKGFVDGMLAEPNYVNRKITQSVIDTSKLGAVATASSALATALIAHPELATQIRAARNATQGFSSNSTTFRRYFDLINFTEQLEARVTAADILAACQNVDDAVRAAVVWEGHNAQSPDSRGLAIDLSDATSFAGKQTDYLRMKWATDTTWDQWLAVAP